MFMLMCVSLCLIGSERPAGWPEPVTRAGRPEPERSQVKGAVAPTDRATPLAASLSGESS
jgi:hypothetical protein